MKRTLRGVITAAVVAAGLGLSAARVQAGQVPRADYQAVAHAVAGRVGQTVEVELGVRNGGGGAADAGRAYEVTAPPGTRITSVADSGPGGPERCAANAQGAGTYLCAIGPQVAAGESETLRFHVRIDSKVEGAEGWVRIVDREATASPDPDPDNDAAPILVDVTDSGPSASGPSSRLGPVAEAGASATLLIATTSGTALSAGAIVLGVARRRED
ncbi:DUF11 domain-containing protein [Streptomyces cinnamoneus]|uniref:DUF11 domain-containing protein n=1 Tax=Streptomyces cinnamoneus TaxID=53446 RepID=UPI0015E28980|nr:DUF11 domain-containing protein [Streptomyces cinnamoneus]